MLSYKSQIMIQKLSELLLVTSGHRPSFSDAGTSPRGPLDEKLNSPTNSNRFYPEVIGLGIIAALDDSGCSSATPRLEMSRSDLTDDVDMEMEMEEYTYVTSHLGPNKSETRVYYDGYELVKRRFEPDHSGYNFDNRFLKLADACPDSEPSTISSLSDLLGHCHSCSKILHGQDIYMYRGEKAFCSAECRSIVIADDEARLPREFRG